MAQLIIDQSKITNKEEFINSNADWILKTPIEVFNLLNSEKTKGDFYGNVPSKYV